MGGCFEFKTPTIATVRERIGHRATATSQMATRRPFNGPIRTTHGERGKPPPLGISVVLEAHGPLTSDHTLKGELLEHQYTSSEGQCKHKLITLEHLCKCFARMLGEAFAWGLRWSEDPSNSSGGYACFRNKPRRPPPAARRPPPLPVGRTEARAQP